jgi:hypothetical protein
MLGSEGVLFVAKLNGDGSALLYSVCLGGNNADGTNAIAVDSSGNAYFTGFTNSTDFPGPGGKGTPLKLGSAGGYNAFVAKLDTSKVGDPASLLYSALLGGDQPEDGAAIAVDSSGNVYVTGDTGSDAVNQGFLITSGAFDKTCGTDGLCIGTGEGFVALI